MLLDSVFVPFNASNLPPYQEPVLVRIKASKAPPFRSSSTFRASTSAEETALLAANMFYGYAVVVLEGALDGFGKRFPLCFRHLELRAPGECVGVGEKLPFESVAAWATLPSTP